MKYRRFIVGIIFMILLLAGTRLLPSHDPIYKGKRLSRWVEQLDFSRPISAREEAEEALRGAGPLALPLIESMLRARTRPFEAAAIGFYEKRLGRKWPLKTAEKKHGLASHACFLLGTNALPVLPALIDCLVHSQNSISSWKGDSAIARLGPAATAPLIEQTTNQDSAIRRKAASLLGFIGAQSPESVKRAFELLQDTNQTVRVAAAAAIANIAKENSAAVLPDLNALNNLLTESDPNLRVAAAGTLNSIGRDAAATVPNLLALLDDKNVTVRIAAIDALSMVAPQTPHETKAVERLLVVRNDTDGDCRKLSLSSLGFFPNEAHMVLPILIDGLTNSDPSIVTGCLYSLIRLGRLGAATKPETARLEQLTTNEMFRHLARSALIEMRR